MLIHLEKVMEDIFIVQRVELWNLKYSLPISHWCTVALLSVLSIITTFYVLSINIWWMSPVRLEMRVWIDFWTVAAKKSRFSSLDVDSRLYLYFSLSIDDITDKCTWSPFHQTCSQVDTLIVANIECQSFIECICLFKQWVLSCYGGFPKWNPNVCKVYRQKFELKAVF